MLHLALPYAIVRAYLAPGQSPKCYFALLVMLKVGEAALEAIPQQWLQTYVLLALGSQASPLAIGSIPISVLTAISGLTMGTAHELQLRELADKASVFAFLVAVVCGHLVTMVTLALVLGTRFPVFLLLVIGSSVLALRHLGATWALSFFWAMEATLLAPLPPPMSPRAFVSLHTMVSVFDVVLCAIALLVVPDRWWNIPQPWFRRLAAMALVLLVTACKLLVLWLRVAPIQAKVHGRFLAGTLDTHAATAYDDGYAPIGIIGSSGGAPGAARSEGDEPAASEREPPALAPPACCLCLGRPRRSEHRLH